MIDHPLIPDPGDAVYMPMHIGDSTIKLRRRPRFTLSEAVALNVIVNAAPNPVAIGTLQEKIGLVSPFGRPTRSSIAHLIGQIRAKLGEQRRNPTQLVSIRGTEAYHRVIGYRWVDNDQE
jgi:hypothetical protein